MYTRNIYILKTTVFEIDETCQAAINAGWTENTKVFKDNCNPKPPNLHDAITMG